MGAKRLDMIHGGSKLFIVDQIFQCPCSLIRWFMKRVLIFNKHQQDVTLYNGNNKTCLLQLNLNFLCVLPLSRLPFFLSMMAPSIFYIQLSLFCQKAINIWGGGATPTLRLIYL